jgi:hypothetical protein
MPWHEFARPLNVRLLILLETTASGAAGNGVTYETRDANTA